MKVYPPDDAGDHAGTEGPTGHLHDRIARVADAVQVLGDELRLRAVAQDLFVLVLQAATLQRRLTLQQMKELEYVGGIGHSVVVVIYILAILGPVGTKHDVLHVSPSSCLPQQASVALWPNSCREASPIWMK